MVDLMLLVQIGAMAISVAIVTLAYLLGHAVGQWKGKSEK